jgi:hypothetical protein
MPEGTVAQVRNTAAMVDVGGQAGLPRRNGWTIACFALVLTSWGLLASLELADALLSADSASNSTYDPVYALYAVVMVAAPVIGLTAVTRARGRALWAWLGFVLALVMPTAHAIAIITLITLGGDPFGPAD